ncbi:MAG: NADH-quinone oxidoreductase subunit C [Deltaproteobacteria bacterium]|nr:NADH-quinone oxidoreductase subunit C [Deltaproteobacteria bacterium]
MVKLIDIFKKNFQADILDSHEQQGNETIVVSPERLHDVLGFAKNDPETLLNALMDLCAVDYLGQGPRFEVVYHLYSTSKNHRLRIKTRVPEENPKVKTCVDLWKSADWFEREAWDMLGIVFEGHPNLKRLLLFDGFEGHPLRKDYKINRRQKIPEPLERP